MNIVEFSDIKDDLINYFKSKSILPVIGSGFTVGEKACNGFVPSGESFKNHIIEVLEQTNKFSDDDIHELKKRTFSEIASFYENEEFVSRDRRIEYYKNNFSNVVLGDLKKQFLEIDWPYIYTLNIDDAIENNSEYKDPIISNRKVYDNAFNEKRVLKIHGDVKDLTTYEDSKCLIFTDSQYALSIKNNYSLLVKMETDFRTQNIIYIGCSLSDEIDLLSISNIPFSRDETHLARRFFFFKRENDDKLSVFDKQKLSKYNITDVIMINNYDDIYKQLYQSWIESKKVSSDELDQFTNIPIKNLTQTDRNEEYFYFGKLLHNKKENILNIPYNFIDRTVVSKISNELVDNSLILLEGGALSGKSYLLASIYVKEKSQHVYYFDSSTKISSSSFEKILKKENSIFLFDISSLNRNQFDVILNSVDKFHNSNTKFIIALSYDRSDMLGLVKLKLINKEINEKYISKIKVQNFFDKGELNKLNLLLPKINVPVFLERVSIIDNLISTHQKMKRGKYSEEKLKISSYKELVALIILMTQEKIYTYDQVKFGIEQECCIINLKYPKFVEELETVLIEKDSDYLSNYKYILNAKLWLQSELTFFANKKENYEIIQEAYFYIVEKIMQFNGNLSLSSRESYREYILFDSINSIFINRHKENYPLILSIYEKLDSILSNDYQFLHQYAKGLLILYLNTTEKTLSMKYLTTAKDKIIIAESILNKVIENKEINREDTYRNSITLAHMQFTESLILCEIVKENNYVDEQLIEDIITKLHEILVLSTVSETFMQGSERSSIINNFLLKTKDLFNSDKIVKRKISELLTYMVIYK